MSTMNPTVKRILPWVPLIVSLILGLVLGLLIGWVWWPVSWTNASIADLSVAQKSAYVGAVSEAYVFNGTAAATEHMQASMAPFGADVAKAVTGALEYYRSQPVPDEVMLANIAALATDLNIPVDAAMIAPAPAEVAPSDNAPGVDSGAAQNAAPGVDAAPTAKRSGSGVLTWILAVLLSAGLIGAGFYLLMRLRNPRELTDSMKDPADPVMPGDMQPVAGGSQSPTRTTAWSRPASAPAVANDDDLSFEDEDEEEPAVRFNGASGDMGAPDADDDYETATPRYSSARSDAALYGDYTGASYDAADLIEEEEPELAPAAAAAPAAPVPDAAPDPASEPAPAGQRGPGGAAIPADAPPVDINALTPPSWAAVSTKGGNTQRQSNAKNAVLPAAVATAAAAAVAAPEALRNVASVQQADGDTVVITGVAVAGSRTPPVSAVPSAKPIASYTLQYNAAVSDYIEACNINHPVSGAFIGECGMGVSSKNPLLHNNPDQVIALDVWMYDKSDARDHASSTRVLLSPFAVKSGLTQAFGDGSAANTVEAHKGSHFVVEGQSLYLDGDLVDVTFDEQGAFRTAKVQLNVRAKRMNG